MSRSEVIRLLLVEADYSGEWVAVFDRIWKMTDEAMDGFVEERLTSCGL